MRESLRGSGNASSQTLAHTQAVGTDSPEHFWQAVPLFLGSKTSGHVRLCSEKTLPVPPKSALVQTCGSGLLILADILSYGWPRAVASWQSSTTGWATEEAQCVELTWANTWLQSLKSVEKLAAPPSREGQDMGAMHWVRLVLVPFPACSGMWIMAKQQLGEEAVYLSSSYL